MKILDSPLHIHRRRVEEFSDWTGWSQHQIPELRHLGPRPMIDLPLRRRIIGSGDLEDVWYSDRVLDDLIRTEPVIFLLVSFLSPIQLESLRRAFSRTQESRLLVASARLPGEWPGSVRVITCPTDAYLFSLYLERHGFRPQHNKRMENTSHALGLMTGRHDQGRTHLVQMLAGLGVLDDCLVGSPAIPANATSGYQPDPWAMNGHLPAVPEHRIGDRYHRWNLEKNFPVLLHRIERCRVWISMDNDPLLPGMTMDITEKMLWATATGTPGLGIWHDSAAGEMKHWGFDVDHESARRPDETEQEAVMRWSARILLLHRMTQDPEWCQRWYDTQAPRVAHNSELIRRLHLVIRQDLQRQLAELPREFAVLV